MKKILILLVATMTAYSAVFAADDAKLTAPKEPTAEQVAKMRESIKADMVNWEALDSKDFVARNQAGEPVNGVIALIHTKRFMDEFKASLKGKVDEKTAKAVYEFEKSNVVILQCTEAVASLHTVTPASGKVPMLGETKPLTPMQVQVLVDSFCKK